MDTRKQFVTWISQYRFHPNMMVRTPPPPFHTTGSFLVWSGNAFRRAPPPWSFCPPTHAGSGRSFPFWWKIATFAVKDPRNTPKNPSWWNISELAPLSAGTIPSSPPPTWEEVGVWPGTHLLYIYICVSMKINMYIQTYTLTLHCITLHCITLHCITLHCITLHCMTLHYIHAYIRVYMYIYIGNYYFRAVDHAPLQKPQTNKVVDQHPVSAFFFLE